VLNIEPRHYFKQALFITLLNPKAIVFYMAFFPLFVDPARHQGLLTFGVMALTIAALTFAYGLGVVLLTHFLAERMRANPVVGRVLEKAGRRVPDRLWRQAGHFQINPHGQNLLRCQPEGRRRQDHHHRQPGRRAGQDRPARADGRPGPAGQRHHGLGRGQAQARTHGLRRAA
jgi:hypothetical protein